ncbi:MAG: Phage protein [uncultured Thermomicrobiales bacterium]|uniref:Phage protein n=1 Tax=uncultured Thermomicrobiales bacterium TaxID=1645740 RepID=A0A6J4UNF5_9BACT|nr:MAG: Phage protein [uncultured Thermomicrobiales bacterium]
MDDSPRDDDGQPGDGTPGVPADTLAERDEVRGIREDGPRGANFDPSPYFRQLRGRGGSGPQDYLDVKWRLLWLRREHPDAHIVTEHVRIDETSAIFKATVDLPSGGRATGYGSETAGDFGDFIEKAETKAIGRALNALGYGAQFAEGEEDGSAELRPPTPGRSSPAVSQVASSTANRGGSGRGDIASPAPAPREPVPIDRQATATAPPDVAPATPLTISPTSPSDADQALPAADRAEPKSSEDAATDTHLGPVSVPASRGATPRGGTRTGTGPANDSPSDIDMADYSHTAFWKWAREQGFLEKADVERKIGRAMKGLTPREVRELLIQAGATP